MNDRLRLRTIGKRRGTTPAEVAFAWVLPTLVLNPDNALKLAREEVFGPVLTVTRVADADEALWLASDIDFGLAANLWTKSLKTTLDLTPRIEAGTVWVNSHVMIDSNMPFGKSSNRAWGATSASIGSTPAQR